MKSQTALSIFIYLLLAELLFYAVMGLFPTAFSPYLGVFIAVAFCLTVIGFLAASFNQSSRLSIVFYLLLWITTLVFFYLSIFHPEYLSNIAKLYFALAVLVALLISLLDRRTYLIREDKEAQRERQIRLNEKSRYQSALQRMKELNDKYKTDSTNKQLSLLKTKLEMDRFKEQSELVSKRLAEAKAKLELLESRNKELSHTSEKYESSRNTVALAKREMTELEQANARLKRELSSAESQRQKQAELKEKYSKTLRNIHKEKRELEALLVVSPDGKSVHRPNCIVVRNIRKEDRKLIPNWKEARRGGYKGCKLCNPDKLNESVQHNSVKYRFVGSNGSDKFHKPSCTVLAHNINPKDKQFFKTYKQAVKAGYTPCRICNPQQ